MKSILYLSDLNSKDPIFHSQVIPHVSALRNSYTINLVCFSIHSKNSIEENVLIYRSVRGGYDIFFSFINFIINYKFLKRELGNKEFDIIYGRGLKGGMLAIFVKLILNKGKGKTVFDCRADILDENPNLFFRILSLKVSLYFLFRFIDYSFFVSTFLRDKYVYNFSFDISRSFVFPTFVPDDKFKFCFQNRAKLRNLYSISNDQILLVYSGNLAPWQNLNFILDSFSKTVNPILVLLILTKDLSILDLVDKYKFSNRVLILDVSYDDIQMYYHFSDIGLLIRDNTDTNKASAPTKFSEYVNSGLMVLLNKIDSDYTYQFMDLGIHGFLLDKKEDLTYSFNSLNLNSIKRNSLSLNTLSNIIFEQKRIFEL